MAYQVTFIPGDGIGPEVAQAARRCIDATGVQIAWEEHQAGLGVMDQRGTPLPDEVLQSITRNRVALKGPITTPIGTGIRSVNVMLRKLLNLYACVRPCKLYPGIPSSYRQVDLLIFRENTEDLYAGIEFDLDQPDTARVLTLLEELSKKPIPADSAISIKPISVTGSKRIARFAFEYAAKFGRKKVTCVHKANIMKFTDGLFMRAFYEVAKAYEGRVAAEDRLVDNLCMQLVQAPDQFDCLVLPNLYGDIISDLCAGLVGGLGVAPGANIGDECAVFEATHGSAPKYQGQNKVNPTAVILSGAMMLRHLGERQAAERLEQAVASVIAEGRSLTYDLARQRQAAPVGTREMADAIIAKLTR